MTYIGDCKMAALGTRAQLVADKDYYLCPLSALQMPATELDQLLKPVLAGRRTLKKVFAPPQDGANSQPPTKEEPLASGFEDRVCLHGKDQAGTVHSWDERRLVVRSVSFAQSQEKSLRERINRAQEEIEARGRTPAGQAACAQH